MSTKHADRLFNEAVEWMGNFTKENEGFGVICPISIARALGTFVFLTTPDDLRSQAISVIVQEVCEAFNNGFEYEGEKVQ